MSWARLKEDSEDYDQTRRLADRALEIARTFPSPDSRFVESASLILRQDAGDAGTGRAALLDEAEAAARKLVQSDESRYRPALADILDHRIGQLHTPENTHAARQLALAAEALELRLAAGTAVDGLIESRTQVAHAAMRYGDPARAEILLKENVSQAKQAGDDAAATWRKASANSAYARFLMDQERWQEALTYCAAAKPSTGGPEFLSNECAAYAHLKAGQPAEALKIVNQYLVDEATSRGNHGFGIKQLANALNLGGITPPSMLILGREAVLATGDASAQSDMEKRLQSRDAPTRRDLHCRQSHVPALGQGRRMRQDLAAWHARWRPCEAATVK